MDFYRYHALGNDYLVIDPNKKDFNLTPEKIQLICHRNFGVGSDGILYGPFFENGSMSLRIFNPDGGEAEKSGNGIRIFSRYLFDAGYVKEKRFTLQTLGGQVEVELLDEKARLIKVDMGTVTFESNKIPVNGSSREVVDEELTVNGQKYQVTCLSIGNPHCVIPMDEISETLAREIGPFIEKHPQFPNRINMQLLKVIDRSTIQIEIWERGAGYTLASGSSSSAAASAAYRLGLVEKEIKVLMPGGAIAIEIRENGHVFMTGTVTGVAKGEFMEEMRGKLEKVTVNS